MAHELETMAYTSSGGMPWHGLGIEIGDNLSPAEILAAAQLNWSVSKRPLFYPNVHEGVMDMSHQHIITGRYALVRNSDDRVLDVVGSRYQPVQNEEAFEFFDRFVKECNLKMHTAGSLCNGQYVWALAKTNNVFDVAPDDTLDSYILLISPHKLGKSLIAKSTGVRVVCKNTIDLALRDGKAAFCMSHSRKFDDQAKTEAAKVLGLVTESFTTFGAQAQFLSGQKANIEDVRQYFGSVFSMDDETIDAADQRSNSTLDRLLDAYQGNAPGADLPSANGTWWGAVNAVTWVLDHRSGKDRDRAMKNTWFGWRGDAKRTALQLAMKMAA